MNSKKVAFMLAKCRSGLRNSGRTKFGNQVSRVSLAHVYGFTLAEVLITLSVLGVVAMILVPNMIHKIQDRQQITAVKKYYALFDNAFSMLAYENHNDLTKMNWPHPNYSSSNDSYLLNQLARYINVDKFCYTTAACRANMPKNKFGKYRYLRVNGTDGLEPGGPGAGAGGGMAILHGGAYLSITVNYPTRPFDSGRSQEMMGAINVDINGAGKGPNRQSYDRFVYFFNRKGMTLNTTWGTHPSFCSNYNYDTYDGMACVSWIMRHNNMDYKYRDVRKEW